MSSFIDLLEAQVTAFRTQETALTSQWLLELDERILTEKALSRERIQGFFVKAQERCLKQLLRAMVREGIWGPAEGLQLLTKDMAGLPLPNIEGTLLFENVALSRWGAFREVGSVQLQIPGEALTPLCHPSQLLALMMLSGANAHSVDAVRRFYAELLNSMLNDALFLAYRELWRTRLQHQLAGSDSPSFWQWCISASSEPNISLFLEQWGTVGHPIHPGVKCKQGLTSTQVLQMSPEFEGQVAIRLVAVHKEHMHMEMAVDGHYPDWFKQHYPDWYQVWFAALEQRCSGQASLSADDYLPIPMHPWQAAHTIPRLFSDLLAQQGILLLEDGPQLNAGPTMSFRTMVPENRSEAPHIKLPIALRLTSGERVVSTRSCEMGPRFSLFLQQVITEQPDIGQYLGVISEEVGGHFKAERSREDADGKHLSVLFRQNPMGSVDNQQIPVPVATLLADTPITGAPLFIDMVLVDRGLTDSLFSTASSQQQNAAILQQFRAYINVVLQPTLGLYLYYGISLEAHQQNSFVIFNHQGCPKQLLIRDFGAFRIYEPVFKQRKNDLRFHHDRSLITEDVAEVRNKLMHAVFICHLAELVNLVAGHCGLSDQQLWQAVRSQILSIFDAWESRSDPDWWRQERQAILEQPWYMKRFTLMRLADNNIYNYQPLANPLVAQNGMTDAS